MIAETTQRKPLEEVFCGMCGQKFFRERGSGEEFCEEHRLEGIA